MLEISRGCCNNSFVIPLVFCLWCLHVVVTSFWLLFFNLLLLLGSPLALIVCSSLGTLVLLKRVILRRAVREKCFVLHTRNQSVSLKMSKILLLRNHFQAQEQFSFLIQLLQQWCWCFRTIIYSTHGVASSTAGYPQASRNSALFLNVPSTTGSL